MASPNSMSRCRPMFIEYTDGRTGTRVRKRFTDAYAARRFWIQKDKAGRNPKVVSS